MTSYYLHVLSGSSGEKKKKSRTSFTNRQLNELETIYRTQRYLPTIERKRLAHRLQLSDQQVCVFVFQI
jgi:hypothetical protein